MAISDASQCCGAKTGRGPTGTGKGEGDWSSRERGRDLRAEGRDERARQKTGEKREECGKVSRDKRSRDAPGKIHGGVEEKKGGKRPGKTPSD